MERCSMSHIYRGSASVEEIKNFIGEKDVVVAYAKNQDNPREIGYDYWYDIKHPDTGETLKAVKGYCNPNNTRQCYYAEYQDKNGHSWHYLDSRSYPDPELRGSKSIQEQINEDQSEYKRRQFFESESADEKSRQASTDAHKSFFEENGEAKSNISNDSANISAKSNINNNHQ